MITVQCRNITSYYHNLSGTFNSLEEATINIITNHTLTVCWSQNVKISDITGCYFTYITKESNLLDEFLGYGYHGRETGRLNITSH